MTLVDWIALGVIILIIGGAVAYIIKAKKSGKKCIGCPDGASCHSKQENASGGCGCGACSGHCSDCKGE